MAASKEKLWSRAWRGAKTVFFLASMLASLLLVCAPPLLVVLLDLFVPSALLGAVNGPGFISPSFASQLRAFRFRDSLVDLPVVSIARSLLILCFYLVYNGRGPYLGVTTVCAAASAGYVSLKVISMFGEAPRLGQRHLLSFTEKEGCAVEGLFLSSLALAIGHVVAAYRTSCRERRKLLVYKIDVEAMSALLLKKITHSFGKTQSPKILQVS
ncbi:hypothetical protein AXF42_Ash008479 [Apostasia shenzhenica]|uniref:MENTAL domain-containing protein n=1 Tax=Apostasia shenzhenica TaxID=1088818 RepID=A0A2I0AY19_9ASPA|nr:hypothetical protein AXF42_Ash008479 [Apostasia shenzhenica]